MFQSNSPKLKEPVPAVAPARTEETSERPVSNSIIQHDEIIDPAIARQALRQAYVAILSWPVRIR